MYAKAGDIIEIKGFPENTINKDIYVTHPIELLVSSNYDFLIRFYLVFILINCTNGKSMN